MIECRGRNGWFKLVVANVTVFRDGTAAISISSKQTYRNMPPIYLSGPLQEVQDLLDDLQAQLIAESAGIAGGLEKEERYAVLVGRD